MVCINVKITVVCRNFHEAVMRLITRYCLHSAHWQVVLYRNLILTTTLNVWSHLSVDHAICPIFCWLKDFTDFYCYYFTVVLLITLICRRALHSQ